MDALTDILETIHLRGSLYCRSELGAPWGMAIAAGSDAQFHVVRRGRCWLRLTTEPDTAPILLEAGDMVVLPRGHAHQVSDHPDTPVLPLEEFLRCQAPPADQPPPACSLLRHGGDGEQTTLVCGYFRFDRGRAHPLLSVLPPLLLMRGEGGRARPWIESLLDLIAGEAANPGAGGEILINRLTEALLIQVIRAHLASTENPAPSWLAGLRDPQIAAALALIHHQPEQRWTLEQLAARVGLSRSGFAARFRELVGEPPLQYLTRWRLQLAANHLQQDRLSLAEVAHAVGYRSETGFSKSFKRLLGIAPGSFRRQARNGGIGIGRAQARTPATDRREPARDRDRKAG